MTQTIRQRETLSKIEIGSRYQGVPFDRPALRQMPREWIIEEEPSWSKWWRDGGNWVGVFTYAVGFCMLVSIVRQLAAFVPK